MSKAKYLFYLAVSGFISLLMQGISGLALVRIAARRGPRRRGKRINVYLGEIRLGRHT